MDDISLPDDVTDVDLDNFDNPCNEETDFDACSLPTTPNAFDEDKDFFVHAVEQEQVSREELMVYNRKEEPYAVDFLPEPACADAGGNSEADGVQALGMASKHVLKRPAAAVDLKRPAAVNGDYDVARVARAVPEDAVKLAGPACEDAG